MTSRIFSAIAGAALAAGMVALSTPVLAADTDQSTAVIQIADLNLHAPQGMQTLERRVRQAANKVCGAVPTRDLSLRQSVIDCQEQVRASAMSQAELAMGASSSNVRLALRAD
jgi:UrcA family protein